MDRAAEAVDLFRAGCACSQAVVAAFSEPLGLDRATALRVASGFAGGMRLGGTCGAVTGALMVLGLRHGGADCATGDGRAEVYARVLELQAGFQQRHGSLLCRELLGCDLSTPQGMQQAREQGLFRTACPRLVRGAAELLEEMGGRGAAASAG